MTDLDPRPRATPGPGAHEGPELTGPRPAVPAGLGRVLRALVVVALVSLALLAAEVFRTARPNAFDRSVHGAVHARWQPGTVALRIDALVTPVPVLVVTVALAVLALASGRRRLALVAVGPAASYVVTSALKPLVGRTIHGHNLSFPSGHAAYATSVGLVIGLLVLSRFRRGTVVDMLLLLVLGALAGTGMAVDQIILDAHYPSDAVGGALVAVLVIGGLALLVDAVADRQVPRSSRSRR